MNPLEQLIQNLMAGGGGTTDWLWCIDESFLHRHIATRSMGSSRMYGRETSADLTTLAGETAIIKCHGVMLKEQMWTDEVSTVELSEAIKAAADNDAVRSILLDVDSPGGSASGLVQLAQSVAYAKGKKPIITQSAGMIASAAYFFASGTDKIYAERGDLIGSIGTRLHVFDFSKLFENIGVKSIPVDTGSLKSAGVMGTEITQEHREYFQKIVDGFQSEFSAAVTQGRGFDEEQYKAVATGGVFHVAEARKLGLIDGIRTKAETLAAMPKRKSSTTVRSETMSEPTTTVAAEQPASIDQLERAFPKASSDFLMSQLKSKATMADAYEAYAEHLEAENAKLVEEKAAAEKKAEDAAKQNSQQTPPAAKVRGNKIGATAEKPAEAEAAQGEPVDYWQMASDYQKEKKCRWSEACLEIKRRHPEAREAFGAPPRG